MILQLYHSDTALYLYIDVQMLDTWNEIINNQGI